MWWANEVTYQIYPRSFCDSNKDGIGDIKGIISKLSYLKNLGIGSIWISPILKSPQADFGYDIENYFDIDPIFGTLKEFEKLIKGAHKKKLRIIMDLALSHTSIQCPWFQESRKSKEGEFSNWYVWADAKEDGSPPNNWQSVFGGSAWTWEPRRRQYYLHNFLKEQPDLNFYNPRVQAKVLEIVEYWFEKGVDGLRLDVCNFYFHDAGLKDNPPRKLTKGEGYLNPYNLQSHLFDKDRPENFEFFEKLRKLSNQFVDRMLLGEIYSDEQFDVMKRSLKSSRLHTAYCFEFLHAGFSPEKIIEVIHRYKNLDPEQIVTWSLSNHDVERVASRWRLSNDVALPADTLMAILFFLKGAVIIYQGEELGLQESELKESELRDPFGINFYPDFKGRDGCRTPIPWEFKKRKSWLPYDKGHLQLNVQKQLKDKTSTLSKSKGLIKFRNEFCEFLVGGDIEANYNNQILCIKRSHDLKVLELRVFLENGEFMILFGGEKVNLALYK